jgi:hypothetical protein
MLLTCALPGELALILSLQCSCQKEHSQKQQSTLSEFAMPGLAVALVQV